MKLVILAGGLGTRISEESVVRPKPMVEIGDMPILWHIMKMYSSYGVNEFIICLGYKGYVIKEFFANYFLHSSDVTFDLNSNSMKVHRSNTESWTVTLVDTGQETNTGGRIKRISKYLNDETFCLTYGDGVSDINIKKLIEFHIERNRLATLTAVRPAARFGSLNLNSDFLVKEFKEKPDGDGNWVNGGFLVCNTEIISRITSDDSSLENNLLTELAALGQLVAYKHDGFWQPMDTLRDKLFLNELWRNNCAPWKTWT